MIQVIARDLVRRPSGPWEDARVTSRRFLLAVAGLALTTACGERPPVERAPPLRPEHYEIAADDRPPVGEFLRYAEPKLGVAGGLDIAVTDYVHPEGRVPVRMIGVVHIADAPYYRALQRELDECETVLFEAVMPRGAEITDWIRSQHEARSELAGFQHEIAGWFGFEWQLHAIDYSSPRFVLADMTLEEFRAKGGDELLPDLPIEGEEAKDLPAGVQTLLRRFREFGRQTMADDNPMRSIARKLFAEALGKNDLSKSLEMFPGLSELILVKRNEVALKKLEEVLPAAKGIVGVFYGAAHMEGLEKDLLTRLGYVRKDARWYRAWALRPSLR
jgi:hypothetical protein